MSEELNKRTEKALGAELMRTLRQNIFCIIGCGAVGSIFAEMLVRTGVDKVRLIDGDEVEESNLNRCFSYVLADVGKKKTDVLKSRLLAINPHLSVKVCGENFRKPYGDHPKSHKLAFNSTVIIAAMDNNTSRVDLEEEYKISGENIMRLSIGVETIPDGNARYEVAWQPKTNKEHEAKEGYGNGSYASVVAEATAAGFNMLLAHLNNSEVRYKSLYREYCGFVPSCEKISR